jgi:hypothetical protein
LTRARKPSTAFVKGLAPASADTTEQTLHRLGLRDEHIDITQLDLGECAPPRARWSAGRKSPYELPGLTECESRGERELHDGQMCDRTVRVISPARAALWRRQQSKTFVVSNRRWTDARFASELPDGHEWRSLSGNVIVTRGPLRQPFRAVILKALT